MNVTPLVDVVLVLLIIFMIVLPALEEEIPVAIPGVSHSDEQEGPSDEDAFVLSLTSSGSAYLNEQRLRPGQVQSALARAHAQHPRRPLVLRGDEGLTYGQAREAFRGARAVGFTGIALRVRQREGAKEETR